MSKLDDIEAAIAASVHLWHGLTLPEAARARAVTGVARTIAGFESVRDRQRGEQTPQDFYDALEERRDR